jgi:hypothetical protein
MLSQAGFHCYANWIVEAQRRKERAQKGPGYSKLLDPMMFGIDDYDVRKKGDHVESYNRITGETLFEAHNETEAWQDIREAFTGN